MNNINTTVSRRVGSLVKAARYAFGSITCPGKGIPLSKRYFGSQWPFLALCSAHELLNEKKRIKNIVLELKNSEYMLAKSEIVAITKRIVLSFGIGAMHIYLILIFANHAYSSGDHLSKRNAS